MLNKKLYNPFLRTASVVLVTVFIASCASVYHGRMMRGNILKQQGNNVYLCIGTKDGATEGQELNVYSFKENRQFADTSGYFDKILKGKIKITNIVHEHYAKATIIEGKVRKGDIAELGK